MLRTSLALALFLVGCAGKSAPPAATAPSGHSAGKLKVVTLKALENGDRACYVIVETTEGEQSLAGDFSLCEGGDRDATALLGQEVVYTTAPGKVAAVSCQGDPECTDSDDLDLVMTIKPADAP